MAIEGRARAEPAHRTLMTDCGGNSFNPTGVPRRAQTVVSYGSLPREKAPCYGAPDLGRLETIPLESAPGGEDLLDGVAHAGALPAPALPPLPGVVDGAARTHGRSSGRGDLRAQRELGGVLRPRGQARVLAEPTLLPSGVGGQAPGAFRSAAVDAGHSRGRPGARLRLRDGMDVDHDGAHRSVGRGDGHLAVRARDRPGSPRSGSSGRKDASGSTSSPMEATDSSSRTRRSTSSSSTTPFTTSPTR